MYTYTRRAATLTAAVMIAGALAACSGEPEPERTPMEECVEAISADNTYDMPADEACRWQLAISADDFAVMYDEDASDAERDAASERLQATASELEAYADEALEDAPAAEMPIGWPDTATLGDLASADVLKVDEIYIDYVREAYPDQTVELDDETITSTGHGACLALDDGATLEEITQSTLEAVGDPEVGAYIIGGGLATYCAEWIDALAATD